MIIQELQKEGGAGLIRYDYRKVADYDKIKNIKLLNSRDIDVGLIDSYGYFDLSEIHFGVEEYERDWLSKEINLGDHKVECEINTDDIIEMMAIACGEYFEREIEGLELRLVSVFSPAEYNFITDWCEFEVVKSPFKNNVALVAKMRELVLDKYGLNDDYRYNMFEALDEYMREHIAGYMLDYKPKVYSYDELYAKLGGVK